MSRRLVLLGATGSIGRSTLEVVDHLGDVEVVGLSTRGNVEALATLAARYHPRAVAVEDRDAVSRLRPLLPDVEVLVGAAGLAALAAHPAADVVLVAVVGMAGLAPTLAALQAGKDVALATKEALVAGGHLVMAEARRRRRRLFPVDSEHSAIFQCLQGVPPERVRRIVLTASGGPFRQRPIASLSGATPAEALSHPTWKMGKKITVDSATLMNKGLEVIEARWLFDLRPDQIDVVIHPQSLVHGLVETVDGSVLAQLAPPDMRLPIQYALTYPDRRASLTAPLALAGGWGEGTTLTFEAVDVARYPCLGLAREALLAGGTMPVVMNAANEVAVDLFLGGRLPFGEIATLVRRAMDGHRAIPNPSFETIEAVDQQTREALSGRRVEVR